MTEPIATIIELHAPPERVWRAISDAKELAEWLGSGADLDLRPGGHGWFEWEVEGRFHVLVEEVEPPTRLVWRWANAAGESLGETDASLVDWNLTRRPDGGTTLRLTATDLPADAAHADDDRGWGDELRDLFAHLDGEAAAEQRAERGDEHGGTTDGDDGPPAAGGPPLAPAGP